MHTYIPLFSPCVLGCAAVLQSWCVRLPHAVSHRLEGEMVIMFTHFPIHINTYIHTYINDYSGLHPWQQRRRTLQGERHTSLTRTGIRIHHTYVFCSAITFKYTYIHTYIHTIYTYINKDKNIPTSIHTYIHVYIYTLLLNHSSMHTITHADRSFECVVSRKDFPSRHHSDPW